MLSFGQLTEERPWNETVLNRLKQVGEVVANALAHARADERLCASREEARQLAGRLLTAQEDERRRLAREMHDDVTQRLAATAIAAGKFEDQFPAGDPSRKAMSSLKDQLIALSDDVHRISRQLHPAILDDLGLEDTLRSECDRFAEREGVVTHFHCGDLPDRLPKDIALCLYRIAQEALRNAAKHAQTDRVELVLNADAEFLDLEVRDFGRGFFPETVRRQPGLGLASMEERTRLIGGELTISSVPSQGTSIAVRIPLPEDDR
jgi:signal transduction histidine kinase